jgi:DNA-directed RNA polymerase specialized sigma subunit
VDKDEVKQALKDYRSALARYRSAREAYSELLPGHVSVASGTGRVQTDSARDHQELVDKLVQHRVDLKDRLTHDLAELCQAVNRVTDLVELASTEQERAVLHMRYIEGLTREEVAARMYCTTRTVARLTDQALTSIARALRKSCP